MAKGYGRASEFIADGARKRYKLYIFLTVGPILTAIAALFFYYSDFGFQPGSPITLIIFLIYLGILYLIFKLANALVDRDSFFLGGHGEYLVDQALAHLPGNFVYFRNMRLNNHSGDIDFVLVGSKGIFTIEAKSHKGKITFSGYQLLKNGWPFKEKDILKQARQEGVSLSEYLRKTCGFQGYVKSVVVFSHPRTKMSFGLKPVDGHTYVIQKVWLEKFIYSFPNYTYNVPPDKISQALMKLLQQ